ncbi:hypothetical protein ACCO45_004843 [Purpureocillium lilacinum]|uniref:Uncharacterized protein n=1 Tax=Purpureocillium lilacinum TaxID=33203 RepID=A0ACC4DWE9_PURLI
MQPQPGLPPARFHEWYNNEHGPTRLRIPQIFTNGLRYRSSSASASSGGDDGQPGFMAVYDVTDMALLATPTYTSLRANRSPREAQTIAQVDVRRRFFDLLHTRASPLFAPLESLTDEEADGIVTVAVEVRLRGRARGRGGWFVEEHAGLLSKVPGWLRSRLFKTSALEDGEDAGGAVYFALHDYAKENASMDTPWRTEVFDKYVASKGRHTWSLFYIFGPAPRELESLSSLPDEAGFTDPDGNTSTVPGSDPVLNSYITTPDGLTLPYPPTPATLEALSSDLAHLLDALRVPTLHALVGVSMGGATALNFALTHPRRLDRLVACDFNAVSSPANTQAWKDRVAVAESDGGSGIKTLAEQTVARWFHPESMRKADLVEWMTDMVAENDVDGFKHSCTALWDYDMKPQMPSCGVPSLLVVGEGDAKGALVKAMDGFKGSLGAEGEELKIVPNAGHLPMCEEPDAFWGAIKDFL